MKDLSWWKVKMSTLGFSASFAAVLCTRPWLCSLYVAAPELLEFWECGVLSAAETVRSRPWRCTATGLVVVFSGPWQLGLCCKSQFLVFCSWGNSVGRPGASEISLKPLGLGQPGDLQGLSSPCPCPLSSGLLWEVQVPLQQNWLLPSLLSCDEKAA